MTETRAELVIQYARNYLGVRFAHQGRNRETGVDCLGLLLCAARDAGMDFMHHDRTDYGVFPDANMLRRRLVTALELASDMRIGNVALFAIEGRPQHLALVTDYPAANAFGMIHAYAPMRKVVEHRFDDSWKERLVQLFRIPNGPEGRRTI